MFDRLKHDIEQRNTANPIIRSEIERVGAKYDQIPQAVLDDIYDFVSERNYTCYDYTQFDGNAEGFRILTKLQFLNDLCGLNLTAATLAASVKYPNVAKKVKKEQKSRSKHGVFYTEKDYLNQVMDKCGIKRIDEFSYNRHPIAYLMEAADSICYLLMDLEDAISKGWLTQLCLRFSDFPAVTAVPASSIPLLCTTNFYFSPEGHLLVPQHFVDICRLLLRRAA